MLESAAVFLPLVGAIIAGLFGRRIGHRPAEIVTTGLMFGAMAVSIWLFFDVALGGNDRTIELFTWIDSGSFEASWALRLDTLSVVMLNVVTIVSTMVHLYSIGYMHHDEHRARFFAYLSLFTFSMLMLVTADNFLQMFFGWEGVGLCSYLLIGFWFKKDSANSAAIKAFVVNRVGDFGFALGIAAVFLLFGSIQFDTVFEAAGASANLTFEFLGLQVNALTCTCILLFIGAMGKSAQLGLHTWLPDAMEGPTPVSALIHAATMVTAGVFMVARLSPMFEHAPDALAFVAIVGALTAFVAATIGMTQFDIKRVIAYSTMSQLGYMFFAAGVSAYSAAIFHLMTHAFFKALLFLGAGSVIHAMSDEQDMRNMGGLRKLIPYTYWAMMIGSLALAGIGIYGVWGFAGFYSKDIILESAWARETPIGQFAYWLGVAAALMTAFYSFRLVFMTFHGKSRADHHTLEHVHESPATMLIPLAVLSLGALFAGIAFYDMFVHHGMEEFWREAIFVLPQNNTVELAHEVPFWVKQLPVLMGVIGILGAYIAYIKAPDLPGRFVRTFSAVHNFVFRKWYFDELYRGLFVKPSFGIGRFLWINGDGKTIDRLGPDGIAGVSRGVAALTSRFQSGYVFHYAFAMLIGVFALVSFYLVLAR